MIALLSVIALAAGTLTPDPAPSTSPTLPFLWASPPAVAEASAPVELARRTGGLPLKATCTALCGSSPSVSCTGTTCTAVNQSCPGTRGSVSCTTGGVTTTIQCPVCAAVCTEGQFKTEVTGPNCSCEDGQSTPKDRYKCIGGEWVYQFSFCGPPFCIVPVL